MDKSDWDDMISSTDELRAIKFAQSDIDAAVLAEREACAKVCEQTGDTTGECPEMAGYCADAIRMRSNADNQW